MPEGDTVSRSTTKCSSSPPRRHEGDDEGARRRGSPVRRVMIAGGGNIGLRLAKALEDRARSSSSSATWSARGAPRRPRNTLVLTGDAADEELLLEENIDDVDVFFAVTNDEEANILSSMLAKRSARRVMALINKPPTWSWSRAADRHRDLAADHHDRRAARARAPRRRGARAFAAPRRGRGHRGDRARRQPRLARRRQAHRGDRRSPKARPSARSSGAAT